MQYCSIWTILHYDQVLLQLSLPSKIKNQEIHELHFKSGSNETLTTKKR